VCGKLAEVECGVNMGLNLGYLVAPIADHNDVKQVQYHVAACFTYSIAEPCVSRQEMPCCVMLWVEPATSVW
jgi:hypothetical protein